MTQGAPPTRRRLLPLALVLLVGALAGGTLRADEPESDPWVAKVGDKTLYLSRLAQTVAWRMRTSLQEAGSGPTTILRQLIEERAVLQEAKRLGLSVSDAEVRAAYDRLDRLVKEKTRGAKTLAQQIEDEKMQVSEFLANLRHQLLKEAIAAHPSNLGDSLPKDDQVRIAQTEIVITELLKRTNVLYGWRTALQEEPTPMPPDHVATVNGEPITMEEYGKELLERLPTADIRQIIQQECKAALTAQVALSEEAMGEVIDQEKERWNRYREMTTQEAYRTLSYEDYVKMQYRLDLDQMRQDRYFRGLFGLILQERAKVTPEMIQKEYAENREGLYGDAILVTDIEILFAPQNPLLGNRGGRTRKEALQLANEVLRRHSAGEPFDAIVSDVNSRRDPTFRARKLRVRNTSTGRLIFDRAKDMQDGDVARPFETLSEVHVLRREAFEPAPTFEDVKDIVLEGLAQRSAHDWLERQIEDPAVCQVRWPLEGR